MHSTALTALTDDLLDILAQAEKRGEPAAISDVINSLRSGHRGSFVLASDRHWSFSGDPELVIRQAGFCIVQAKNKRGQRCRALEIANNIDCNGFGV